MSDIEIVLEEEKKPVEGDVVIEEKVEKPALKVEDGIAELKRRLGESEAARKSAEDRARNAESTISVAKEEVKDSHMHLVTGAIETVKTNMATLKNNYKVALASGNFEEAAEINEKIAITANRLTKLEDGKVEMERQAKAPAVVTPPTSDVVEQFVSRLSPKSAEWVRNHPECVRDTQLNQAMIGAHSIAMRKKIPVDTPEYFEFIENALDMKQNVEDGTAEAAGTTTGGRQAAPASAPVSRVASTGGGTRPNVVRLSEAEREVADSMGMSYQEYGKNKLALQRSGKIN
jgi:flavin-binding protein dodecin